MPSRRAPAVLTAFFAARAEVPAAVQALLESGVPAEAIRILPSDVRHAGDLGVLPSTKAPEGAALGALMGGVAGALAGALAASGAIVVPGFGAVLAGPLVAALAGAGAGGAAGMIAGAIAGACLPEIEAAWLDDAAHTGGALLAVRCHEEEAEGVEETLATRGAFAVRCHARA